MTRQDVFISIWSKTRWRGRGRQKNNNQKKKKLLKKHGGKLYCEDASINKMKEELKMERHRTSREKGRV